MTWNTTVSSSKFDVNIWCRIETNDLLWIREIIQATYISDIDECEVGTDTCDNHATCTNTDGSFTCTCNTGFFGDGYQCEGNI